MSRELDALVAEKVMEWTLEGIIEDGKVWNTGGYSALFTPEFTTNAATDYEVLKHVREKWDMDQWDIYRRELLAILAARTGQRWDRGNVAAYEPGDYSMAALKALGLDVSAEVEDGL